MKFLKGAAIFLLIGLAVMLGGCNENGSLISSLTKVSVSDILDTELPCVNAEELYERKRFSAPPELLTKYGFPSGYDGNNIYFLRDSVPASEKGRASQNSSPRTALIAYYDLNKGELVTLFEEDSDKYIFYNLAGVYDSCIYYYRGEASENHDRITTQLYRLSIYSRQSEIIIDFEMPHHSDKAALNSFCTYEKSIFFSDGHYKEVDGETVIRHMIYRYNTQNGLIEEFIEDAKDPVPYREGIAYFREKETGIEIHYLNLQSNEDKIIAENLGDIINGTGYSDGGDIFVETAFYDGEDTFRSSLGYIDENGFTSIAVLPENSFIYSLSGKEMLLLELDGRQLIYDSENGCFARLNINREYSAGYAAESSVLFFCYDDSLKNTVIYVYVPRADNRETTTTSKKES